MPRIISKHNVITRLWSIQAELFESPNETRWRESRL